MKNTERKDNIEILSALYYPYMVTELLKKMPTESVDPDGSLFEEFIDLIQTARSAASDSSLSKTEKHQLEAKLKLSARKFGLSHNLAIDLEK